jgi:hypothetical protein
MIPPLNYLRDTIRRPFENSSRQKRRPSLSAKFPQLREKGGGSIKAIGPCRVGDNRTTGVLPYDLNVVMPPLWEACLTRHLVPGNGLPLRVDPTEKRRTIRCNRRDGP